MSNLRQAVRVATRELAVEKWTPKQAKSYLLANGVGNSLAETLCDAVVRWTEKSKDFLVDHHLLPIIRYSGLAGMHKMVEEEHLPVVWLLSGIELDDCVDVAMHLVFLGMVKSNTVLLQESLSVQRKETPFNSAFGGLLTTVARNTRINWLQLREYKDGGFRGWVSANHMAFARVCRWFFHRMWTVKPGKDLLNPTLDFDCDLEMCYRREHLVNWCRCRDILPRGTPTKAELAQVIRDEMKKPEGERAKLPQVNASMCELMNRVIVSQSLLVSLLMQKTTNKTHRQELDRAIKLHLSYVDELDEALVLSASKPSTDDHKPKLLRHTNYLTLLNLPEAVRKYGPVCLWWEGDKPGEGILREVKEAYHGMVQNCHKNLLQRIYRNLATKIIHEQVRGDDAQFECFGHEPGSDVNTSVEAGEPGTGDNPCNQLRQNLDRGAFFRYKCGLPELKKHLWRGELISGVFLNEKEFICFLDLKMETFVRLTFHDSRGTFSSSTKVWFSAVSVGDRVEKISNLAAAETIDYFVLLPQFNDSGAALENPKYYCVLSSWRERLTDGRVDVPDDLARKPRK